MTQDTFDTITEQFFVHIGVERGLSPSTVSAYRHDIKQYIDFLQAHNCYKISDVTSDDIESFITYRKTVSARTRARQLASIHEFHKFAMSQGFTSTDVSQSIKAPKTSTVFPSVLSIEEVSALLEAASVGKGDDPVSLRDRALLEFMYASGSRVSEAVGINISDIDLDHGLVRLLGKGNKERLVPIGSYAVQALTQYLNAGRGQLQRNARQKIEQNAVFLNKRGRRLSRQSVWEIIQYCAHRAHIETQIHPHTLRHCYATHLISGGADVRTVQELLGHSSVTTTQIYTHISPTGLMQAYVTAHPRARNE